MPCNCGTPLPELPGASRNQFDWLSLGGNETAGVQQSALMRGHPVPLSYWQARQVPGPRAIPQPVPFWLQSRPYDRGAAAYAPRFGQVSYNPIGAGIVSSYRLPTITGPGARYQNSAIWFDVQTIPTSMGLSPTAPIETLNALIGTSHVSATYKTTA